jgi:ABC-type transport system substrate-binding protein
LSGSALDVRIGRGRWVGFGVKVVGMRGIVARGGAGRWFGLGLLVASALSACGPDVAPAERQAGRSAGSAPSMAAAATPRYFGRTTPPKEDVFRFTNQLEPEVLDPGLMSGQADGRIGRAIFEGLTVQHPRTLEPMPGMAERWEISPDGRQYIFHVRSGARWTNGDPVTARDFEWSWLRVLDPDVPSRYADLFYLLRNGRAYKKREITDASQVGVRALDDSTLQVDLEAPTPYFLQLVSYYSFLPVPRATLERFGDRWTRPENIVTNGRSGSPSTGRTIASSWIAIPTIGMPRTCACSASSLTPRTISRRCSTCIAPG